jgi:hypothetical protein
MGKVFGAAGVRETERKERFPCLLYFTGLIAKVLRKVLGIICGHVG